MVFPFGDNPKLLPDLQQDTVCGLDHPHLCLCGVHTPVCSSSIDSKPSSGSSSHTKSKPSLRPCQPDGNALLLAASGESKLTNKGHLMHVGVNSHTTSQFSSLGLPGGHVVCRHRTLKQKFPLLTSLLLSTRLQECFFDSASLWHVATLFHPDAHTQQ